MNISELEKIIEEQTGNLVCPICSTPFSPRHSRQKTCGSPDCKRLFHNQYLRERNKRLKAEDKEAFNKYHAEANKKWRRKQKFLEELDELQEYCKEQVILAETINKKVSGIDYGKRQAEKTLASVPKIDVEAFMRERRKE